MNKSERDKKGVIQREDRYATLAEKEGDYAAKQAVKEKRKGLKEMAKDSAREALIGYMFAKKRRAIADREKKMLRGKT